MRRFLIAAVAAVSMVLALPAVANNSWGSYHWDGSGTPVPLTLENNLNSAWSSVLTDVVADWTSSPVLDLSVDPAAGGTNCVNPLANVVSTDPGEIQVCNESYGANGWLGVARIWIAADGTHITAAIAAVNDSYFSTPTYNNANAKRHVLCQEVGHAFGLDHQHGPKNQTCMNDQWGLTSDSFTSPNQHDYDQLNTIYAHLGGTTGSGDDGGGSGGPPCSKKPDHPNCSNRAPGAPYSVQHLANGQTLVTYITWAPGHGPSN